jgi:phosphomevalonate kinase
MIAGEYAVLEGAEAVVAAVDRRVQLTLDPTRTREQAGEVPPEVAGARAVAERRLGAVDGAMALDVSALRSGDRKLGLGSSSAAAAAAAGAVYAAHERDTTDPAVRQELLRDALEGHETVAPQGSGADVAAAVLGGFVRFRRDAGGLRTSAIAWPDGARLLVAWTGKAVRTSDMVAKVRALQASDPDTYQHRMGTIADAATALITAMEKNDVPALIRGFDAHADAMGGLGRASGAPIIDDTSEQIQRLARDAGGAAKPSGAGGGDVVLAVFPDRGTEEAFRSGCASTRIDVLSIIVGDVGERVEEQ